jgi:hypothetical protein
MASGLERPARNTSLTTDDEKIIQKCLFNAWNTELVLRLPSYITKDLVKYSNHWAPVQAYYAIYLCLQAYFRSSKDPNVDTHASALRTIASQLRQRKLLLPFWSVICHGTPPHSVHYKNLPPDKSVGKISTLSNVRQADFWDWYGMALRTTRERQLKNKLAEKAVQLKYRTPKGTARRSFTAEMKEEVCTTMPPTTVFDFLYRLRIRSNYEDADAFVLGSLNDEDAVQFHAALCKVTACTMFGFERLVAHKLGKTLMHGIADSFARADKNGLSALSVLQRKAFWL